MIRQPVLRHKLRILEEALLRDEVPYYLHWGERALTILLPTKYIDKHIGLFAGNISAAFHNVSWITIQAGDLAVTTPGVTVIIAEALTAADINVLFHTSGSGEIGLVIQHNDLQRALEEIRGITKPQVKIEHCPQMP